MPIGYRDPPDAELRRLESKGAAVLAAREFVIQEYGEKAWAEILAALPAESRKALEGRILGSAWLPHLHANRLMMAVEERHGTGDGATIVRMGRHIGTKTFTTVYRAFARVVNPMTLLKRTDTMWHLFSKSGRMDVTLEGETLTITLREYPTSWAACKVVFGVMTYIMDQLGQVQPLEHPACQPLGAPNCVWRTTVPGTAAGQTGRSAR